MRQEYNRKDGCGTISRDINKQMTIVSKKIEKYIYKKVLNK